MKRVESTLSNDEWKEVQDYLKQHEVTIYALLKTAVLEKVRKKPRISGPLDEFVEA